MAFDFAKHDELLLTFNIHIKRNPTGTIVFGVEALQAVRLFVLNLGQPFSRTYRGRTSYKIDI